MIPQETERQADLVPEVEPIRLAHEALIGRVRRRQLGVVGGLFGQRIVLRVGSSPLRQPCGGSEVRVGHDVLVTQPADQGYQAGQEASRVAERPVSVQGQVEQVLAQQDDLLGARQHARAIGQPRLEGVLAKEAVAEGVEGADLRVVVAVRHQAVDALDHLERRAIGEGQRQDLGWLRALLGDEPRDPAGDDRRLARAGTGHDEQWTITVRDRLALARGEVRQEWWLDPEVRPAGRRCRRELLEDGELVWRRHDRWHFVDGNGGPIHPAVINRLLDSSPVADACKPRRCRGLHGDGAPCIAT